MEQKKITVIIPTYNRPQLVEDILNNQIQRYSGKSIKFEIHDSSENNDTSVIFDEFKNRYKNENVEYFKYPSSVILDDKVREAVNNIKTKYYYLLGDGLSLDYDSLEKNVIDYIEKDYDVVVTGLNQGYLATHSNKVNKTFFYNTGKEFVLDNFSLLTLFGGYILKTDVAKTFYKDGSYDFFEKINEHHGYSLTASICTYVLKNNDTKTVLKFIDSITGNKIEKPKETRWIEGDQLYKIGFGFFYNTVDNMEYLTENEKKQIYHRYYIEDWGLFNWKYMLYLRSIDSINHKYNKEYEYYLEKTDLYNKFAFYSYVPKFICKFAMLCKKAIKGIINGRNK